MGKDDRKERKAEKSSKTEKNEKHEKHEKHGKHEKHSKHDKRDRGEKQDKQDKHRHADDNSRKSGDVIIENPISEDDFFLKNEEFRVWLRLDREKYVRLWSL